VIEFVERALATSIDANDRPTGKIFAPKSDDRTISKRGLKMNPALTLEFALQDILECENQGRGSSLSPG
jgi:hypothetical protein